MAKKNKKSVAAPVTAAVATTTTATDTPPAQLMDMIETFLSDQGFSKAHREFQKHRTSKGWKGEGDKKADHHSLVSVFQAWETFSSKAEMPSVTKQDAMEVSDVSSDESSDSSSESEDEDDSEDVEMADTHPSKDDTSSSSSSSSDSEDSDSDSESDSDAEDAKATAATKVTAANPLKRKAESDSDSSSSDSDDDSSSDSSSEDDKPQTKKLKTTASSDSDSSSSSESSEEDESVADASDEDDSSSSSDSDSDSDSSDSDSEVEEATKVPLPESDSSSDSSSSSDSDSDSEAEKKKPKPSLEKYTSGNASDTSATLDKTSPETFPVSTFAPLPPDPVKQNNRGKNVADGKKPQNEPFSRIKKDVKIDPRLSSNAYVEHGYGQKAHEDLIVTKGKGFTKEKNKKKRGAYKGGPLDVNVTRSIKFED